MKAVILVNQFRNKNESHRVTKKIVKKAQSDQSIYICIHIPEPYSVWEYDLNAEINSQSLFFGKGMQDDYNGQRNDEVKGLVLDRTDLIDLESNECAVVNRFSEGFVLSNVPGEIEIISPNIFDIEREAFGQYLFYVFPEQKIDPKFPAKGQIKIQVSYKDLIATADIANVKEWKKIRELIPSVFDLPVQIQDRLKTMPLDFKSMPQRLKYFKDAYNEFWQGTYSEENKLTKHQISSINEKVIDYLFSQFQKEDGNSRRLARSTAIQASEIIKPDYLYKEHENFKSSVSLGVPTLFWILHCVVTIISDEEENGAIIEDGAIAEILYSVSRPKHILKLRESDRNIVKMLWQVHPEVKYLRGVEYSKELAAIAAKMCE